MIANKLVFKPKNGSLTLHHHDHFLVNSYKSTLRKFKWPPSTLSRSSRNIMYNCEVEMWKTRSQKQDDCPMKSSQLIPDRLFLTDFKDSTKKRVRQEEKRAKAYDTRYSQAVSHLSTDRARRCLTSVIGRELVFSTWYGCKPHRESARV